jgi:hypothetical protein
MAVIALLLGFVALKMGTSVHVAPTPSDIPHTIASQGIHDSRPSADFAISQAIDAGSSVIIAQTATQPANGTSEADITAELVGSWATAVGRQSEENARQACRANGGDEKLCSHGVQRRGPIEK